MEPIFKDLAKEYPELKWVHIDMDDPSIDEDVEKSLGAVPAYRFYKNGKMKLEFRYSNLSQLRETVEFIKTGKSVNDYEKERKEREKEAARKAKADEEAANKPYDAHDKKFEKKVVEKVEVIINSKEEDEKPKIQKKEEKEEEVDIKKDEKPPEQLVEEKKTETKNEVNNEKYEKYEKPSLRPVSLSRTIDGVIYCEKSDEFRAHIQHGASIVFFSSTWCKFFCCYHFN